MTRSFRPAQDAGDIKKIKAVTGELQFGITCGAILLTRNSSYTYTSDHHKQCEN